jgi:hypothetical protein
MKGRILKVTEPGNVVAKRRWEPQLSGVDPATLQSVSAHEEQQDWPRWVALASKDRETELGSVTVLNSRDGWGMVDLV